MGAMMLGMLAAVAMGGSKPQANFSNRLWAALPAPGKANRLVSPTSVDVCLRMLLFGSAGKTQETLAATLGLDGQGISSVGSETKQLLATLRSDPGITISNAIFAMPSSPFKASYVKEVKSIFDGTAETLPANAPAAVDLINQWVSEHTKKRIPKLIDQLNPAESTVLVNAITFDGKWSQPFKASETQNETFHGAKGDRQVPMMAQKHRFSAIEKDGRKFLFLPYEGGRTGMMLVLPRLGESPAAAMGAVSLSPMELRPHDVDVKLPRFTFTDNLELAQPLTKLGMGPLFSHGDFSPMSPSLRAVSRVIHKAMIKVNEKGTEAAAATGVVMTRMAIMPSSPMEFHADRPFGFAIVNSRTGEPLFMGVMNEPGG